MPKARLVPEPRLLFYGHARDVNRSNQNSSITRMRPLSEEFV